MHKLVILIEPQQDWQTFETRWPDFLHLVEAMPGLRREATSHVEHFLYGERMVAQVHELFFDSLRDAENAMTSPEGQSAGRLLQQMTSGQMTLFIAEHKEDELPNILKYKTR